MGKSGDDMNVFVLLLIAVFALTAAENPNGIHGVEWGINSATVQTTALPAVTNWRTVNPEVEDNGLPITAFSSDTPILGYQATTTYYFYNDSLYQATIAFHFRDLENFDFNYNVFISVDKYYREIRSKTLVFVNNIYSVLRTKYGRKQPVFLPLDPRKVFMDTDNYIAQERWNLRYHPSEYHKRIIGRAYARWRFPETEINFAVNIAAADDRFDYTLSYISTKMRRDIANSVQEINESGL